jgi:hypothetical protein
MGLQVRAFYVPLRWTEIDLKSAMEGSLGVNVGDIKIEKDALNCEEFGYALITFKNKEDCENMLCKCCEGFGYLLLRLGDEKGKVKIFPVIHNVSILFYFILFFTVVCEIFGE